VDEALKMPCELRAIEMIMFNIYQDHNISPFKPVWAGSMAKRIQNKACFQLHAQAAINQCSSDYWIHMNQYV